VSREEAGELHEDAAACACEIHQQTPPRLTTPLPRVSHNAASWLQPPGLTVASCKVIASALLACCGTAFSHLPCCTAAVCMAACLLHCWVMC
jgi:hypothetical protein